VTVTDIASRIKPCFVVQRSHSISGVKEDQHLLKTPEKHLLTTMALLPGVSRNRLIIKHKGPNTASAGEYLRIWML